MGALDSLQCTKAFQAWSADIVPTSLEILSQREIFAVAILDAIGRKFGCSIRTGTMSDQTVVKITLAIVGAVALSAFALLVKKRPPRKTDKPASARENSFRFIVGWVMFGAGSIIVISAGLTYLSGDDDPFNILFGAFGALNVVYGLSLLVVASRSRASQL